MRNQIVKILALVLIGVYTGGARAAEHVHADHEAGQHLHIGTEPIGVMGAHAHAQGDWMFSYRAMRMEMDGNRDGSSRMSTADVLTCGLAQALLRPPASCRVSALLSSMANPFTRTLTGHSLKPTGWQP